MLDPDTIIQQFTLLAEYRRTLAHLLTQAAQYGGDVFAPPQTANGIAEARQQIRRIKAVLRKKGVPIEDNPNDKAPRRRKLAQSPPTGDVMSGDKVAGDKVGGDKVMGDKNIINQPPLAPALHQLRAPVGDFVGREQEIDQLVQALSTAATNGAAAAISGVRGMGGVGKTELAYVVAQQLKDAFPDAQLLVELRGASSSPLTPEQALQTVIRAFEREAKLPDDLGQLKGLYNTVLSGKRVFILADDTKDAAQVRPLQPPQGCALLVTSRTHFVLPRMVALDLKTLPPEKAEALLLEICPRIGEYVKELAKLCGYLPKALRVSANLLANRTSRHVAAYLEQLSDERTKLAHLRDEHDPELDIETSLHLSYDALEAAARIALCQLSVFPTSFGPEAARNVVEVPSGNEIDGVLEELCLLSLLEWDAAVERYSLHELVRVFATARLADTEAVRLRHAQHYARVASHAQNDLYLKGKAMAGLALFDQERTHIDAGWMWAIAHAGEQDADILLLKYSNALYTMAVLRYDNKRERIPQLTAQLAVAQRLKRRNDEVYALSNLGATYAKLGEVWKAIPYYEQALVLAHVIGDRRGERAALNNLGMAFIRSGNARKAIEYHNQALTLRNEIGDRRGEGITLGCLGHAYERLGERVRAIDYYVQAIVIAREIGDWLNEAIHTWNLGILLEYQGDLAQAVELMQAAVDFKREIGHPTVEQDAAYLEQLRQRLAARAERATRAGEPHAASQNRPPADALNEG